MKKVLCALMATLLSGSAALAQTEKGHFLAGAQVGNLTVGTQNSQNTLSVRLSPAVGYFVANRLAVGLSVPTFISRTRYNDNSPVDTYTSSLVALSPFLRYYFNTGNDAIKPYVGASAGYEMTTIKRTGNVPSQLARVTGSDFTYGLQLGLAYFVSNRVSLDLSMNVADGGTGINQFLNGNPGLGVSQPRVLTLTAGFQLFFGK